jgi:hypothetical protein
MTDYNRSPVLSANVVGLPHPERPRMPVMSRGSVLPRPVSLLPNVADSGRICFGAGFRLKRAG